MGEINVGGIRIGVSLATENLVKGVENLQKEMRKLGRNMKSAGQDLTVGLSAPLIALGGFSTKAAIDFQSAFAGVRKTVRATEPEFKMLEKGIRDMAKRLPTSANDIAKVAENAGQLGVKTENILEFTETLVRLGDSTNVTADQAAILLAQFANFTDLPQDQFDNLGAAIVELGNNSASLENKIVDMMHAIGAAGAQIGLSHGEMVGFAAAVASTGIEAEKGGTAISKIFREMNSAVLSGSEDLKIYSKIANTDFKEAFEKNASQAILSFVTGLQKIKEEGKDMGAALKAAGITDERAVDTWSRLGSNAKLLAESLERGNKAFADNKALVEESDKRYETWASQLLISKNIFNDFGISLGQTFAPILIKISTFLSNLVDGFEGVHPMLKDFLILVGGAVALAGPVTYLGGAFLTLWGSISAPALGAIAAIASVSAAGYTLYNNWNGIVAGLKALWADFVNYLGSRLTDATNELRKFINKGRELVGKEALPMLEWEKRIPNIKAAPSLKENKEAFDALKDSIKGVVPEIPKAATGFDKLNKSTDESAKKTERAKDAFNNLNEEIKDLSKSSELDFLKENLEGAINSGGSSGTIQSLRDAIYNSIRGGVEDAYIDAGGVINEESKKLIDKKADYEMISVEKSISIGAKKGAEKAQDSFEKLPEFLAKGITDALINGLDSGFNSESFRNMAKSVGAVFADTFQDKFRNLFKDGQFSKLLEGSFSDFLTGSGLADLGIAYGTTSLANNLSDNKKDTQGGIVSGAVLGASVGSAFGPWGTLIGGVVGAGAGYVAGLTGKSNDPANKSRKNTINFIEGKIANSYLPFLTEQGNIILGDARRFNIEKASGFGSFWNDVRGSIQDIRPSNLGLDFLNIEGTSADPVSWNDGSNNLHSTPGQIGGPGWGNQFEEQFQTVFNSFNALGSAMSQFSGETQTEAAKIGVVLAENLNGNLDNARMLLQSMGVGAKDLEDAFLQIGLSGEQSWHTVEVYMQSISDLTGEGLIGVGDLKGAFGQLTDSAGRGQAALFALQNLAIEAQEKGISNIQDLRAQMLSSGEFSESDVNILFQAIEQRGITTLEGLQGASQRLLGGVVADLETLGFGWTKFNEIANQASLTLAELEKQMNELNNSTIDLNIRVNYEENDKPDSLADAEILPNAKGNVFSTGAIKKFATGGIFNNPTLFGYGNKIGMLGEAGPEAVMPLIRKNGKLGVMAEGGARSQGMVINIDARGAERGVERNIMSALSQIEERVLSRTLRAVSRGY